MPKYFITRPAIAGPNVLAKLNTAELSAIPFIKVLFTDEFYKK